MELITLVLESHRKISPNPSRYSSQPLSLGNSKMTFLTSFSYELMNYVIDPAPSLFDKEQHFFLLSVSGSEKCETKVT